MTTYAYRCNDHGLFDVRSPIGTAPPGTACPTCSGQAVRVFSPPGFTRANASARRLIDASERSAHEPRVVNSLPPRSSRG